MITIETLLTLALMVLAFGVGWWSGARDAWAKAEEVVKAISADCIRRIEEASEEKQ